MTIRPFIPAASILSFMRLPAVAQNVDWPNVGNDRGGTRYSPLRQIDTRNVGRLEAAWIYHSGDGGPRNSTTIECTPSWSTA